MKSSTSPSRRHNNRRAYNWLLYDAQDRSLMSVRDRLRGILYDLGCGEAPYREWILEYADAYVGVDWSDSLHEIKADILANLNEALPIQDSVADTVISLSVMEHLSEPQVLVNEAMRILKPGGWFVLQIPWQWWVHEAPHDYFRYTPYGSRYLLDRAGFEQIKVTPQAGFFTMVILKLNYFSLRLLRGPRPLQMIILRVFKVIWFLAQRSAPILDRLDHNWELETIGYFVTGQRPYKVEDYSKNFSRTA